MDASPYLTSAGTVRYLKLDDGRPHKQALNALYRLVKDHGLPSLRRGSHYLFDMRDIDAWLHGHESAIAFARAQRDLERRHG